MSVISCGQSKNGQLGHDSIKECLDPTVIEALKGKRIISSASGESHSLAISRFGDVYSWGRSKEGQLGVGSTSTTTTNNNINNNDDNGNNGIYLHNSSSSIQNNNRQPTSTSLYNSKPQLIKTLLHERIVKVACGNFHSLALTDLGRVYEWGQLHEIDHSVSTSGIDTKNGLIEMPQAKPLSQRIIESSLSQYLSGEKLTYDSNGGTKPKDEDDDKEASTVKKNIGKIIDLNQSIPIVVSAGIEDQEIVDISGGWAFSAAVTKSGRVYTWGFNEKGQLGLGNRWFHSTPQLVKTLIDVKIVSVACGRQHICAITEGGELFTWGLGVFGQLGHGNVKSYLHPKKVMSLSDAGVKVVQVACGSNFTMARTADSILYSFGHGEYGQLGSTEETQHLDQGGRDNHFKYSLPTIVKSLEDKKIKFVSCGHLHTIALTDENEVYSWGWGSSGALGFGDKKFQLVPQLVASLSGEEVSSISAGEKHTLVVRISDQTSFAFDYKSLVNDKTHSDIAFRCQGDKKAYAHSLFIKSRCPKLYSMILFQSRYNSIGKDGVVVGADEFNENGELIVQVDLGSTVKHQVFIGFLNYLYTDHLIIAPHLRAELGKYSKSMGIDRLAALCLRYTYRLRKVEKIPQSEFSKQLIDSIQDLEPTGKGNDGDLISFKIKKQDTNTIFAHKYILTNRNLYFKTMFECSFKEKDQSEFIVGDNDAVASNSTFKLLLEYIYGNNENIINDENAIDILCLADRFMIEDLKYLCEYHLEQMVISNNNTLLSLTENGSKLITRDDTDSDIFEDAQTAFDNICILMQVADGFMAKRLKRICMETITKIPFDQFKTLNKNEILKKIRKETPMLIRELDNYAYKSGWENSLIELIR